ncbi:hypothetical protein I6F11_27295 [Ensifer sp. NBAIM29]|nr:hypothetical protein [Ensifer sp. NBAIM29]
MGTEACAVVGHDAMDLDIEPLLIFDATDVEGNVAGQWPLTTRNDRTHTLRALWNMSNARE